jgi:hypothetical protein
MAEFLSLFDQSVFEFAYNSEGTNKFSLCFKNQYPLDFSLNLLNNSKTNSDRFKTLSYSDISNKTDLIYFKNSNCQNILTLFFKSIKLYALKTVYFSLSNLMGLAQLFNEFVSPKKKKIDLLDLAI